MYIKIVKGEFVKLLRSAIDFSDPEINKCLVTVKNNVLSLYTSNNEDVFRGNMLIIDGDEMSFKTKLSDLLNNISMIKGREVILTLNKDRLLIGETGSDAVYSVDLLDDYDVHVNFKEEELFNDIQVGSLSKLLYAVDEKNNVDYMSVININNNSISSLSQSFGYKLNFEIQDNVSNKMSGENAGCESFKDDLVDNTHKNNGIEHADILGIDDDAVNQLLNDFKPAMEALASVPQENKEDKPKDMLSYLNEYSLVVDSKNFKNIVKPFKRYKDNVNISVATKDLIDKDDMLDAIIEGEAVKDRSPGYVSLSNGLITFYLKACLVVIPNVDSVIEQIDKGSVLNVDEEDLDQIFKTYKELKIGNNNSYITFKEIKDNVLYFAVESPTGDKMNGTLSASGSIDREIKLSARDLKELGGGLIGSLEFSLNKEKNIYLLKNANSTAVIAF